MEETNYEMDLRRENIHLRCFAHTIMNYRYHWHPDEYELSIVRRGRRNTAAARKRTRFSRTTSF